MIPAPQTPRTATFGASGPSRYPKWRLTRLRGEQAWLALGVLIVAYEVLAAEGELLSEAVDRFLVSHPVATRTVVLLLAAHLLNVLPGKFDPLHLLAVSLRGVS